MLVNISAPWFAYGIIHNKSGTRKSSTWFFPGVHAPTMILRKNKKTFSPWISQSWLHATWMITTWPSFLGQRPGFWPIFLYANHGAEIFTNIEIHFLWPSHVGKYTLWLVVYLPLWKIWKLVGMIIPIYMENIKNVPNHQPVMYWLNQICWWMMPLHIKSWLNLQTFRYHYPIYLGISHQKTVGKYTIHGAYGLCCLPQPATGERRPSPRRSPKVAEAFRRPPEETHDVENRIHWKTELMDM